MTRAQMVLPFGSVASRWWAWLAGELCWLANSLGRHPVASYCEWYTIKDATLRRHGWRDGWDVQLFDCYGPRHSGCGTDCMRCRGTGVHKLVELHRWRLGRRLFHAPARTLVVPDGVNRHGGVVEDVIFDAFPKPPRRLIKGRIRHSRRYGAYAAAWVLFVALGRGYQVHAWHSLLHGLWYGPRRRLAALRFWATDIAWAAVHRLKGRRVVGQSFELSPEFECPECGGSPMVAEVDTWTTRGVVDEFTLHCPNEPEVDHRCWQSDWQPTCDRVKSWMRRHVRRHDHLAEPVVDIPMGDIPF